VTENRNQDLEQLSAFIDGELDVDARAAVTARAARDPAYARELAALSRLKAAAAEAIPVPDIPTPRAPARSRRRIAVAVAACFALIAGVGIGTVWLNDRHVSPYGFALDSAIGMHRAWKAQPAADAARAAIQPISAMLRPNVPDLSANGLDLAYVGARKTDAGKEMMLVGYLGSRGCRLTMFVDRADRLVSAKIVRIEAEEILASVWQAGPLRYALLAEGMAKPRFNLITDNVQRASLRRLPLDHDARAALARSRVASQPCRA